jgi:hypothetical protein
MINWYRALRAPAGAGNPVIEIPVRILLYVGFIGGNRESGGWRKC